MTTTTPMNPADSERCEALTACAQAAERLGFTVAAGSMRAERDEIVEAHLAAIYAAQADAETTPITSTTDQRILVMQAIERFCEMATNHPDTPNNEFHKYGFRPDTPGLKFTRIIQTATNADGPTKDSSVHCFVDNLTGDLLKAEGWKKPAPKARYNLLTEWDVIVANFGWASGYLYADYKRKPVAS